MHTRESQTQSQLITHSQSFATNLALLETMVEEVLNNDHAMVKMKRVSSKGVKLFKYFGN
jgi:hypothetical protein